MSTRELTLTCVAGGRRLTISEGKTLWIGRSADCDLVLPSELVSRRHASIRRSGKLAVLQDHSSNGLRVDDRPLHSAEARLHPPSHILVGMQELTLSWCQNSPSAHVTPQLRRRLHRSLLDALELPELRPDQLDPVAMRPRVEATLHGLCREVLPTLSQAERQALVVSLRDEALGLGPLEPLLADPEVTEIMVIDPTNIHVERGGRLEATEHRFTDAESVRSVIERIITPLGRRIDESAPLVDARLPDGSRVNAIIPPLATRGPCITIRRFPRQRLQLEGLVAGGCLDLEMAEFLQACVAARKNVLVAGGTGSGKTTLLNVLSQSICEQERIVTIEDAAELQLSQAHVVSLEARPANMEGRGQYSIRDLVRNALRMRPDRIIVGECRGGEALDMLQAMNTGHEGSMTTTHANSPSEALARLETLCLMGGIELPARAIRRHIASSLHLVVQQSRAADGQRRITSIAEVGELDLEGELGVHEIYRYKNDGTATGGRFVSTGYLPSFLGELGDNMGRRQ